MAQRRVKYGEAVKLICSQCQIGKGEADEVFWRAVASREIGAAWTEAGIINQERRATRMTGSSFDVQRMLDREAAHDRAKSRLRLLTEVESFVFKDAVIGSEIVFSEAALLSWLSRNRPRTAVVRENKAETPRRKNSGKLDRAKEAIEALYPRGVPVPSNLPNALLCREVSNWHEKDCEKHQLPHFEISDRTILRAAGR
jgi:hypothetical protein